MKRLLKKTFPFILLGASLFVVYLNDSSELKTDDYLHIAGSNGSSIFDHNKNDVIVLIHIPGTGITSLSQSLVTDLVTETPCICQATKTRCSCKNRDGNQWLFQAYNSTGYVCGEYAHWTTLTECPIDQWMENVGRDTRKIRMYWLLTLLREPAARFVQEWHHLVTRDAYFRNEPRLFRMESPELQKKQLPCLVGKKMKMLTLRDFLDCKDNPALNRMTHMLANLTYVNSLGYHGDKHDGALLNSAIANLEQLPFFGISENPEGTEDLLEATLGLKFSHRLDILPKNIYKSTKDFQVSPPLLRNIRIANHLDVRVYDHARKLFDRQLVEIRARDKGEGRLESRRTRADDDYSVDDTGDDVDDDDDDDDDDDNEDHDFNNDKRHEDKMTVNESVLDFNAYEHHIEGTDNDLSDGKSKANYNGNQDNEDDNGINETHGDFAALKDPRKAEKGTKNVDDKKYNDKVHNKADEYFATTTISFEDNNLNPNVLKVDIQGNDRFDDKKMNFDGNKNVKGENIHEYKIDDEMHEKDKDMVKDEDMIHNNGGVKMKEKDAKGLAKSINTRMGYDVIPKNDMKPRGTNDVGRANESTVDTEDVNVFFSLLQKSKTSPNVQQQQGQPWQQTDQQHQLQNQQQQHQQHQLQNQQQQQQQQNRLEKEDPQQRYTSSDPVQRSPQQQIIHNNPASYKTKRHSFNQETYPWPQELKHIQRQQPLNNRQPPSTSTPSPPLPQKQQTASDKMKSPSFNQDTYPWPQELKPIQRQQPLDERQPPSPTRTPTPPTPPTPPPPQPPPHKQQLRHQQSYQEQERQQQLQQQFLQEHQQVQAGLHPQLYNIKDVYDNQLPTENPKYQQQLSGKNIPDIEHGLLPLGWNPVPGHVQDSVVGESWKIGDGKQQNKHQ